MQADVIIIGAGAAGLMCAIEAGKRGRRVTVLEHTNKPGKKILISGGGRCNFTNYHVSADNYLSHNPHFCKSALSRYTQWDFISLVEQHHIPWHEKAHGQLFCDHSSKDILEMLLEKCRRVGVEIQLNCQINQVEHNQAEGNTVFTIQTDQGTFDSFSLVVASGGLSFPKMCATPLGYRIAEQFGHHIQPTRAALVPFTLRNPEKSRFEKLSGVSVDCLVSNERTSFRENILFTHRGLSGPAILQISSYWHPGETVHINLLPDTNLYDYLKNQQARHPRSKLKTALEKRLPKRLVGIMMDQAELDQPLQIISHHYMQQIMSRLQDWQLIPNGTEGYRTAEVTLGGIDCDELSSTTMESRLVPGLYFVGEVVDVTGWLGGYNFQWAWSSGWAAGQVA